MKNSKYQCPENLDIDFSSTNDFPGGSDGKTSAYNAGDPGSIPGSGRSPGEGNGNPLQYSWPAPKKGLKEIWASLVAQMVKRLPTVNPGFNPWVWKISWRRKRQPTLVLLPGKFQGQRSLVGYSGWDLKELHMTEQLHLDMRRCKDWDYKIYS